MFLYLISQAASNDKPALVGVKVYVSGQARGFSFSFWKRATTHCLVERSVVSLSVNSGAVLGSWVEPFTSDGTPRTQVSVS